jgi:histidinol-phosphate aminotransferase
LSAGSDHAIKLVADAIVATSGRVIVQAPAYEQYYVELYGAQRTNVTYGHVDVDSYSLTQFELALQAVGSPCTVFVTNPHSPTGFCFSLDEMRCVAALCARAHAVLVIDEAYVPYNGFDHTQLVAESDHVVLIRSFSKSLGLAGLRLAVVIARRPIIEYLQRWNTANAVSGVALHVARCLLAKRETMEAIRSDIVAARDHFVACVSECCPLWRALPSAGNFVNVKTGSRATAATVVSCLMGRGLLLRCMNEVAGLEGCIRATIADSARMSGVLQSVQDVYTKIAAD